MQLKIKKLIAKEVILILGSMFLTLIIFLLVYPYNLYCKSKLDDISKTITYNIVKSKSLSSQYDIKLKQHDWFFNENAKEYDMQAASYNDAEKLWEQLENIYNKDSIEYKYNKVWGKDLIAVIDKIGFHNAQMFKEFISKNILSQSDKKNKDISNKLKSEISTLKSTKRMLIRKIFTMEEQIWFSIKAFIIILIFLYPIRILYWSFVWSTKTLKQKEE
jgi:hypothetical protein